MAHQEACQVFIEQEIDKGLKAGKTPYSIGKNLTVWLEKLFEAKIPPKTIAKRAERIKGKLATNVAIEPTFEDHSEIPKSEVVKVEAPTTSKKPDSIPRRDSDNLYKLKSDWNRASKTDRNLFRRWINLHETNES